MKPMLRHLFLSFKPNLLRPCSKINRNQAFSSTVIKRMKMESKYQQFNQIEKSQSDDRLYRLLYLNNGLRALVVSDPSTDKSAAALDVNVGSLFDPKEIPGIAHFCEHMLFLGTEKYPIENAYSQYLSEHGGHSNAYTGSENTNYFFEVSPDALEGALDRFAQFFISPLFSPDCTERELKAVDSEHMKNLKNDLWRIEQLKHHLANNSHPYHNFGTGNYTTLKENPEKLGISVRDALFKFHNTYYSANLMRLVIIGKEDLDRLSEWVVEKFSGIKNWNAPIPVVEGEPYTSAELLKKHWIVPVKDTRKLMLVWNFPDFQEDYVACPERYVSHLIGHEGEGSLLSLLKKKGWVNTLYAGPGGGSKGFEFFKIGMELSVEGLEKHDEIIKDVFRYINMIRSNGPRQDIFQEVRDLQEISFRFQEKKETASYASHLGSIMQRSFPPEWTLSGSYLIREYNPELIVKALDSLRVENFNAFLIAKDIPGPLCTEPWYGTEYKTEPLSSDLLQSIERIYNGAEVEKDLHLPKINEFIPTDFETGKDFFPSDHVVKKEPELIIDNEFLRLWHKQDDQFWAPKMRVALFFRSALTHNNLYGVALLKLFVECVVDSLVEYSYNAEVAGLKYELKNEKDGLLLSISGYNHKLPLLLQRILERVSTFEPDEKRFPIIKHRVVEKLKNFRMEAPYTLTIYHASHILREQAWDYEDVLKQVEHIECSDLSGFPHAFFKNFYLEALINGNCTSIKAKELSNSVLAILKNQPMSPGQLIKERPVLLEKGERLVYKFPLVDPTNPNYSIEYNLQIGTSHEKKTRALLKLLSHIAREPCFDQLRTKEQLGYIVWSGMKKQCGYLYYRVILQSERPATYLEQRISCFLQDLKGYFESMSEEVFNKHIQSTIVELTEKPKNLKQETSRFWEDIVNGSHDFLQNDEDACQLTNVKKGDLIEFYNEYFSPESPSYSKISVHAISKVGPAEGGDYSSAETELDKHGLITSPAAFKATRRLGPAPRSVIKTEKL